MIITYKFTILFHKNQAKMKLEMEEFNSFHRPLC